MWTIFFFINWTLRMSDNIPERVQILGHAHIICITLQENRIICCQIFCDLLLKSAFEQIFNVMQVILVKIKWHIRSKWKYLIQKLHNICLSYYFNIKFSQPKKIMSCIYMHSHILHYSIGLRAHHFQSEYCRCASLHFCSSREICNAQIWILF